MQSNNLPIGQANGNVINMKKLFKKLFKLNDIQNVLYFIGKCFEARIENWYPYLLFVKSTSKNKGCLNFLNFSINCSDSQYIFLNYFTELTK